MKGLTMMLNHPLYRISISSGTPYALMHPPDSQTGMY